MLDANEFKRIIENIHQAQYDQFYKNVGFHLHGEIKPPSITEITFYEASCNAVLDTLSQLGYKVIKDEN